jgi:hypothetical protein
MHTDFYLGSLKQRHDWEIKKKHTHARARAHTHAHAHTHIYLI